MYLPKVSVVTVVFNGLANIEPTIQSIIGQNYSNFEYIVIDGSSSDGTLEIIKKYELSINYFISEKDNGIYDAMNKGIDACTGDWVIFMNCGDLFFDNNVLTAIFTLPIKNEIMLICGGAHVRSEWGDFYINPRIESQIWKSFVHQSMFTRIEINREYKFNLRFKAASDFDFVYTLFSKGYKTISVDNVVSDILYISSGFSSVNEVLSKKEVLNSIVLHRNKFAFFHKHYLYHYFAYIRKLISIKVKKTFPKLITFIRKSRDINYG